MRPSSISFTSVIRATSRRMPSNDERTTAFGVSSMMKSTPVRCSSARMLRPSRPMIRPFMSSDGSSTSVTVVSAAWLAATRWSASATRLRARRFASSCASSSAWRTRRASSWRTSSSERASTSRLRLRCASGPQIRSSSATRLLSRLLQLLLQARACSSRSATPCSRRSTSRSRRASLLLARDRPLLELRRPGRAGRSPPARPRRVRGPTPRAPRSAPRGVSPRPRAEPPRAAARACAVRAVERAIRSSRARSPSVRHRAGGEACEKCDDERHARSYGFG